MIVLDKAQIIRMHKMLMDATGGLDGLRDKATLDSALSAALQTFDGSELYPSATAKIARIAYGLVRNHPFNDGNKRIGTYVMLVLLDPNKIVPNLRMMILYELGLN